MALLVYELVYISVYTVQIYQGRFFLIKDTCHSVLMGTIRDC